MHAVGLPHEVQVVDPSRPGGGSHQAGRGTGQSALQCGVRCTQLPLRAVPRNWSVKVAGPHVLVATERLAMVFRPELFVATAR